MNTNSILNFNYNKIDLKLDSSEYYDMELVNDKIKIINMLEPLDVSDINLDSNCFNQINILPIEIPIDQEYSIDNCNVFINSRTSLGWTINLVLNKNNLTPNNGVFYYFGIKDETEPYNYLDNNKLFLYFGLVGIILVTLSILFSII